MKTLIKKVIFYDKLYPLIKSSVIYHAWKKINAFWAKTINNNPSQDFFVIGVTGTNGKTTTVNLLHTMLNEQLAKSIAISTESIKIGNQKIHNNKKMTSLDIFDLQEILAKAKEQGCKIAILEASSQGLDQKRFSGIKFDYSILTNITRDHLDYHETVEQYAKSKKKLFKKVLRNKKNNKYGSFPIDDKFGKTRYEDTTFDKKISYSITMNSDLKAINIQEELNGTKFSIKYLGIEYPVQSPLLGTHNVYNFLAALSVGINIGLDIKECITSLEKCKQIDGRLEKVMHGNTTYFIDFAHTPDALEKTLEFLQKMKNTGKIITVFGATGNKDKEKRPEMGTIVQKYSDTIIITDDDADTENRLNIIKGVSSNLEMSDKEKEIFILPERKFAIKFATELAKDGDIVLLAGKGHETVQLTNYGKRKRSDKKILHYYLSKK